MYRTGINPKKASALLDVLLGLFGMYVVGVHVYDGQFLVEEGIDSISVTPDSLIKTIKAINNAEQTLETRNQVAV